MAQSFLNISESSLTSNLDEVVLICGRYAGLDQRFIQKYTDEEISVGDYILSGGELAALILIETISRFVPGVLGDEASSSQDSFENNWLEAPQFTKPQVWQDLQVPQVLTSGHHAKIVEWKHFCSILVTLKKRPDLFHRQFKNEKISLSEIKNFYELLSRKEKEILQIQDLNFDGINL